MEKRKPTPKDLETIALAKKGGNSADLLLLDKIHELESALSNKINEGGLPVQSLTKALEGMIELIKGKGEGDGLRGPKGDKGDPGINGKDGHDGKNGKDGHDGKDATEPDHDEIASRAAKLIPSPDLQPLRDELEARLQELDAKIAAIPARTAPIVYGPGKTKVILLDLSSQLDGATKSFQIGTNFGIVGVSSSGAPFGAFRPLIDYSGVGKNIVFTANVDAPSALAAGQSLIVTYLR